MLVWQKARMAGFDRLAATRTALGSVKCSSLKASLLARCFAYLIAVLADTKHTIKVHKCFSLLLAALPLPLQHALSSQFKHKSYLGSKLHLCGSPILFISGHFANFTNKILFI